MHHLYYYLCWIESNYLISTSIARCNIVNLVYNLHIINVKNYTLSIGIIKIYLLVLTSFHINNIITKE
ncbi:protein of unknown function [Tenacibaculum sp. 190524A02b]|uniref:Uncharacterized protein n=1 Tax=Tenacibaculum vairaonense TaxID=3137860 RepID=A0ABM9PS11_9FLAO